METKRENKTADFKEIEVDTLTIDEIRGLLRSGDQQLIGEITGFSADYVGKVLDKDDNRSNKLIIEVSKMLLKNRQFVIERADLLKREYKLKRSNNGV